MEKYFIKETKKEVKIGETIEIQGLKFKLTENFIKSNLNFFSIEYKSDAIDENNIPEYVKAKENVSDTIKGRIYKTIPSIDAKHIAWKDELSTDATDLEAFKMIFEPSTKTDFYNQMLADAKKKYPVGTKVFSAAVRSFDYVIKSNDFIVDNAGDIVNGSPTNGVTVYHHINGWAKIVTEPEQNKFVKEAINFDNLLAQVKAKYPVGCYVQTISGKKLKIYDQMFYIGNHGTVVMYKGYVLHKIAENFWVDKLTPLFISQDNVPIFTNDETYSVDKQTFQIAGPNRYKGNSGFIYWYFASLDAAKEFVERNKPKLLETIEKTLAEDTNIANSVQTANYCVNISNSVYYETMKNNHPFLYWTLVLQILADTLNEDWTPDWNDNNRKYYVYYDNNRKEYAISFATNYNGGQVYFKSVDAATKAIDAMGENMEYLF